MKTIIVLQIETEKEPPKALAGIVERRAHDWLTAKGMAVTSCQADMQTIKDEKK